MRRLTCAALLTKNGWIERPVIEVSHDGLVVKIETRGASAGNTEDLGGYVIPGFPNAHSHAFQYAMAGLAEHLPKDAAGDDFWSWREAMYGLAQRLSPDAVEAIAACVYAEMLRHGITAVAEFHYLHHAPDGTHYPRRAELSARLMAAAATAGIHLTIVPVFYQQGGFGKAPTPGQARFLSPTLDAYRTLLADVQAAAAGKADVVVGMGVHSLRAVRTSDVKALLSTPFDGPIHLHIAEQRREVDDCLTHLGRRPVAWLLDECPVDARFNLVHATHMDDAETERLARSGAIAVVCPSTEGNLGDGFFALQTYAAAGGRYTFGTDSHIGLSPLEELRWLDYGQRMRLEKRNTSCRTPGDDSGALLFQETWSSGQRALGLPAGEAFAAGTPFDAVVLDPDHPALYGKPADRRLSALIYAGDASVLKATIRRGVRLVDGGKHLKSKEIMESYQDSLARL